MQTVVNPDGTDVVAALDSRLTTETNHSGDPFTMTAIEAIAVDGRTVVPAGVRIPAQR